MVQLRWVVLWAVIFSPLWAVRQANGQATTSQKDQPAEPTETLRTNANLVLVDVVVRDKGKPVEGLPESAFRVMEDGHEQKISVFEEHKATDAVEAAKLPHLPPHMYTNAPEYTLTSAANVLLLDGLNTQRMDLQWVQQRAVKYLQAIPPGTQIAVFTLGSRLRMVSGFTTDAGTVAKALSEMPARAARPVEADAAVNAADREAQAALAADVAGNDVVALNAMSEMAAFTSDGRNFQEDQKIPILLGALEELGRYLSAMPGRKNLIWFTGGINNCLDRDQLESERACEPYVEQIREVEDLLVRARVALYPVEAGGLQTLPTTNPGYTSAAGTWTGAAVVADSVAANTDFDQQTGTSHLVMGELARETGGQAYVNTNAAGKALASAIGDGSSYYTVGYAPSDTKYVRKYRKIDVHVEGQHDELEYRREYFADDPNRPETSIPMLSSLTAAMVHGVPPLSQIRFDARVLPASDPELRGVKISPEPAGALAKDLKGPVTRYVVDYWIDPRAIDFRLLPDGRKQMELELVQSVMNANGVRANYSDLGQEVTLTPEEDARAQREGLQVRQEIDVPAGPEYLRMGVEDKLSGKIGTMEVSVGGSR